MKINLAWNVDEYFFGGKKEGWTDEKHPSQRLVTHAALVAYQQQRLVLGPPAFPPFWTGVRKAGQREANKTNVHSHPSMYKPGPVQLILLPPPRSLTDDFHPPAYGYQTYYPIYSLVAVTEQKGVVCCTMLLPSLPFTSLQTIAVSLINGELGTLVPRNTLKVRRLTQKTEFRLRNVYNMLPCVHHATTGLLTWTPIKSR